jgi:hypothetical protein
MRRTLAVVLLVVSACAPHAGEARFESAALVEAPCDEGCTTRLTLDGDTWVVEVDGDERDVPVTDAQREALDTIQVALEEDWEALGALPECDGCAGATHVQLQVGWIEGPRDTYSYLPEAVPEPLRDLDALVLEILSSQAE